MIRYYEKEDIEQIAKIIDEDWKIAFKGIIAEDYLKNLNYKDRENRDDEKELAEIYALYVKNDERRTGIGEKLITKAKEILKERGYEEVLLWCLEENKNARNFYEKVGGKLYKERLFKIGNIYYNEVSYKYNLKGELE